MPNILQSSNTISTAKKEDLLNFLKEIELFMFNNLPFLYEDCNTKKTIKNLCTALNKPRIDPHLFPIRLEQFTINIRNRIKILIAHIATNVQSENLRIYIKNWPAIKNNLQKSSNEELILIVEKLVDEAFIHLSELMLQAVCTNIRKKLAIYKRNKSIRQKKIFPK